MAEPTPLTLTRISDLTELGFDSVIDVRSPAEYAEDHLPGAISLPVLDDAERAIVGTIYKQESPFRARKVGAAMVAANAARHLAGVLADKPGSWKPLVYCWRGGQRSGSFASILAQVGWRVSVVSGGWQSWRRMVTGALYDLPVASKVIVLDGNTGSAKTALLHRLAVRGVQVIDLEGLARHRGSLFGAMPGGQPNQKGFETALALAFSRLDPARAVVVEAESSKVGEARVPPQLWKAMLNAPRIAVVAGVEARAAYTVGAYDDLVSDGTRLAGVIARLHPTHGAERVAEWQAMATRGSFADLAADLMRSHYDPRYDKHRARMSAPVAEFATDRLGEQDLEGLADRIAGWIAGGVVGASGGDI